MQSSTKIYSCNLCYSDYTSMIFRLTVDCDLFLYGDDTCLLYQDKDLEQKKELTENFPNICDWIVDNKLCIHIGEDRSNLFSTKSRKKEK